MKYECCPESYSHVPVSWECWKVVSFFRGPLRGHKTGDKADVCLLSQSHPSVFSTLFQVTFCYSLLIHDTVPCEPPIAREKKISKYEMWLFFFFKSVPISYLLFQTLILIMRPWVYMCWSNLRSSVLIFPINPQIGCKWQQHQPFSSSCSHLTHFRRDASN